MNRETRKFVFLLYLLTFHLVTTIYLIFVASTWYIYVGIFIEACFVVKYIGDIKKLT